MDQRFESVILVAEATDDEFDLRLVGVRWCCAGAISEQFFGEVTGELVFVFEYEFFVFVDVAKTSSVGQGIARLHGGTIPKAHSAAVDFSRFAGGAVVVAPATNNVEAFECESRWVDRAMATCAALDIAMLVELLANSRGTADVRLNGFHIEGRLGWRCAQNAF